jgi:hypothetical protein
VAGWTGTLTGKEVFAMNYDTIPDEWVSIPETLRMEIEAAFGTYFIESLAEMYLRGVVEEDEIAIEECLKDSFDYIEDCYLELKIDMGDDGD